MLNRRGSWLFPSGASRRRPPVLKSEAGCARRPGSKARRRRLGGFQTRGHNNLGLSPHREGKPEGFFIFFINFKKRSRGPGRSLAKKLRPRHLSGSRLLRTTKASALTQRTRGRHAGASNVPWPLITAAAAERAAPASSGSSIRPTTSDQLPAKWAALRSGPKQLTVGASLEGGLAQIYGLNFTPLP
jgi:hypothetical protein